LRGDERCDRLPVEDIIWLSIFGSLLGCFVIAFLIGFVKCVRKRWRASASAPHNFLDSSPAVVSHVPLPATNPELPLPPASAPEVDSETSEPPPPKKKKKSKRTKSASP
jgi:hypothetical protein